MAVECWRWKSQSRRCHGPCLTGWDEWSRGRGTLPPPASAWDRGAPLTWSFWSVSDRCSSSTCITSSFTFLSSLRLLSCRLARSLEERRQNRTPPLILGPTGSSDWKEEMGLPRHRSLVSSGSEKNSYMGRRSCWDHRRRKGAPRKVPRLEGQNSEVSRVPPQLSLTFEAKNHRPSVAGVCASQT